MLDKYNKVVDGILLDTLNEAKNVTDAQLNKAVKKGI